MAKGEEEKKIKTCFVVCPIGADGSPTRRHADWLLHEIIEHVLDQHFEGQFKVTRSDKIDTPGMIDAQIISHLLDDDLVIADMSELNPNAFYEMGIRHMKELPIIHMFKSGETIPFDVKLYRAIPFDYSHPIELANARTALRKAIEEVLKPDFKPDNPVIRARGVVKLNETATPEMAVLQAQILEMQKKIRTLEIDHLLESKPPKITSETKKWFQNVSRIPRESHSHSGVMFRIVLDGNLNLDELSRLNEQVQIEVSQLVTHYNFQHEEDSVGVFNVHLPNPVPVTVLADLQKRFMRLPGVVDVSFEVGFA